VAGALDRWAVRSQQRFGSAFVRFRFRRRLKPARSLLASMHDLQSAEK
jgi:hypothetical protein